MRFGPTVGQWDRNDRRKIIGANFIRSNHRLRILRLFYNPLKTWAYVIFHNYPSISAVLPTRPNHSGDSQNFGSTTLLTHQLFKKSPEKSTSPLRFCKNIDLYSNICVVSLTLSVCLHNSLFWVQNNWFRGFRSNYFIPTFQKVGFPLPIASPTLVAIMLPRKYSRKLDTFWLATPFLSFIPADYH